MNGTNLVLQKRRRHLGRENASKGKTLTRTQEKFDLEVVIYVYAFSKILFCMEKSSTTLRFSQQKENNLFISNGKGA